MTGERLTKWRGICTPCCVGNWAGKGGPKWNMAGDLFNLEVNAVRLHFNVGSFQTIRALVQQTAQPLEGEGTLMSGNVQTGPR